jgi:SAM-dependent methyltransferase
MNWKYLRQAPWLDTRAHFVSRIPAAGAILDIGSSDGETLNHMAELRPDLRFHSTDIVGTPERYPGGCKFFRGDIQADRLPWPDNSLDAVTCMQLVEHLTSHQHLLSEIHRLLKPGGLAFFETPHPKTLAMSSAPDKSTGTYTMNFHDDLTHTRVVPVGALAQRARAAGLEVERTGISRNWVFAASYPFYFFMRPSRRKFTAWGHFIGWSAYLTCVKPSARGQTTA